MSSSTKFLMPRLDNYYSDYLQLSFYYKIKDTKVAFYAYEEDVHGGVHSQVIAINLAKFTHPRKHKDKEVEDWLFERFVSQFILVWLHEWFHLIGLSEKGIKIMKELGFPIA